jgi:hypothetical protein
MTGAQAAAPTADEINTAILERAKSLTNQACFTVALQHRRIRSDESEDETFIFRWWADFQFLVVALRRLRRAAQLATNVLEAHAAITAALVDFDAALPGLATMRNVGEHIDDYALDAPKRHHRNVTRGQLQVGSFDGTVFKWLGHQLDIDAALEAAEKLFQAVKIVADQHLRQASTGSRPG